MYGVHRPWRGWDVRVDGAAFAAAVFEPGDRHRTGGDATRQAVGTNWGMITARRGIGAGRFGVRTMFSAEPVTVPGCGTLSFLATGEVCDGDTIHDREQPREMLMELAVDYERPIRGQWRWQVYAGLAGDPALGPPGYTHRPSAMGNPIGPITHHWLDSTHNTFGVVTAAVHNQRWKAEASMFNGREPDENRADIDLGAFDSFSARVSWLATERLALQVSAGRLREARAAFYGQPRSAVTKATASTTYVRPIGATGTWATTAAYAMNTGREVIVGGIYSIASRVALLESSATIAQRHTLFGRVEVVGMPAHHLHALQFLASVFATGKLQGGYVRHLRAWKGIVPGVGATAALSLLPSAYAPRYSGHVAPSFSVFFQARPARHTM
jgi:hypothetical protein